VNMAGYNQAYPQRKISDRIAEAHYYNNIGMRYFFAADMQAAFRHLRKAIELAPDLAYLWSNMGTIYRRKEKFAEAQIAYEHSLALDAGTGIAASNLGHMYRQLGDPAMAAKYSQQARVFRLKNPYYRAHLAKTAYAEQRLHEALTHIKAAIKQHKKDPRFYKLAAEIHHALGNTRAAGSLSKKAAQLTAEKQPSPGGSTYQGLPANKLAL
ncbi:MAG: tetratricopeptide repeat protein, partial [Pseudomonadales bacterium]|nr:tetratricopeptide repeat protein [Pseudomonadales bacterium]